LVRRRAPGPLYEFLQPVDLHKQYGKRGFERSLPAALHAVALLHRPSVRGSARIEAGWGIDPGRVQGGRILGGEPRLSAPQHDECEDRCKPRNRADQGHRAVVAGPRGGPVGGEVLVHLEDTHHLGLHVVDRHVGLNDLHREVGLLPEIDHRVTTLEIRTDRAKECASEALVLSVHDADDRGIAAVDDAAIG